MAPQANALPLSLARMEEVMMMVYSIRFTEATSRVNTSKPITGMDRRICNMKYFLFASENTACNREKTTTKFAVKKYWSPGKFCAGKKLV